MMYLSHAEYTALGGTLDPITFEEFEFHAETLINWYTFNRLKNDKDFPIEVRRLTKYLIDIAQKQADALNLGATLIATDDGTHTHITQQSNDGVSVSYNGMSAADLFESCKDQMINAVKRYLQGVKNELGQLVLYRGLYRGE